MYFVSNQFIQFSHIECVCIIIASFDPVHGPEIVSRLCSLLKTSQNLVRNMSDALKSAKCSFLGKSRISDMLSRFGSQLTKA